MRTRTKLVLAASVAAIAAAAALAASATGSAAPPHALSGLAEACRGGAPAGIPPMPAVDAAVHERVRVVATATMAAAPEALVPWFFETPLETRLPGGGGLPGVVGTVPVGEAPWGALGARRIVCTADGHAAIEEIVAVEPGASFSYVVWGFTNPAAAALSYGFGRYDFAPSPGGSTVTWTYAFALDGARFPGALGALGRALFRASFAEGRFEPFMRAGLDAAASLLDAGA